MRSKLLCVVLATIMILYGTVIPVSAETDNRADTTSRLAGQDHYQTSVAIAEAYNNNGECGNVILASGDSFPDALSASLLSKKLNAPILLVGATVNASSDAFNYISTNVSNTGTVYIMGGTGVIGPDFETKLTSMGYSNIKRLGGTDRYNTNMLIVNNVNVPQSTPVFIASGENFPDALSIGSYSGSKQYPTLLVGADYLPEQTKNYLLNEKPSAVYIAGGTSVVSQDLENQIKALVSYATVTRLAGDDRFGTNAAVLNEFSTTPAAIYLANGDDFQDVLSGSALAAKTGDPIILVDNQITTLPTAVESYLKKLSGSGIQVNVIALGGTDVVSSFQCQQVKNNFSSSVDLNGMSITSNGGTAFYLDSFGHIWAWGGGSEGELGNGTDGLFYSSDTPVQVKIPTDRVITAIASGGSTGYALDSTSQVWAWGDGLYGELGNGKANSSSTPVQVSIPAGKTITAIAGGGKNGYALDSTGHVWAWGYGEKGGLRSGKTFNLVTPVQVYMPPSATKIIAITGGDENGYALDSSGHVWTWGYGRYGEFGNGTTDFSNTTVQVPIPTDTIIAIAGGEVDGYALDSTGHVWAWGAGGLGELGNGTTTNFSTPVQVSIPSGATITAIASGGIDCYALDSTGHVWAWGYGYGGKLENRIYVGSTIPVQVPIPSGTTISAIAGGVKNGYALDSTGHVWAWGNGIYERLGNNIYISNTPVQVPGLPPCK